MRNNFREFRFFETMEAMPFPQVQVNLLSRLLSSVYINLPRQNNGAYFIQ